MEEDRKHCTSSKEGNHQFIEKGTVMGVTRFECSLCDVREHKHATEIRINEMEEQVEAYFTNTSVTNEHGHTVKTIEIEAGIYAYEAAVENDCLTDEELEAQLVNFGNTSEVINIEKEYVRFEALEFAKMLRDRILEEQEDNFMVIDENSDHVEIHTREGVKQVDYAELYKELKDETNSAAKDVVKVLNENGIPAEEPVDENCNFKIIIDKTPNETLGFAKTQEEANKFIEDLEPLLVPSKDKELYIVAPKMYRMIKRYLLLMKRLKELYRDIPASCEKDFNEIFDLIALIDKK